MAFSTEHQISYGSKSIISYGTCRHSAVAIRLAFVLVLEWLGLFQAFL